MTLPERIAEIVRTWPQWSRAERAKLAEITAEVLAHCANGTGNGFIKTWCDRNLADLFRTAQ